MLVWLLASGAFAVFVGQVGSYNKAWGSLAAVIIMLTWLWISGLALLFGAEVNAESERSRELRRGDRAASTELQGTAEGLVHVEGDPHGRPALREAAEILPSYFSLFGSDSTLVTMQAPYWVWIESPSFGPGVSPGPGRPPSSTLRS